MAISTAIPLGRPRSAPAQRPQRLLVAWLPAFRLERCGWEARDKVALIAPERNAMRVQALTPGASRLGIRRGMGAAEARALVPDLVFEVSEERNPTEEIQDLQELSRLLQVLSPALAPLVEHRDAITADLTDTAHLFGNEQACLDRAVDILNNVGHRCRVIIVDADRAGAAHAARALAIEHDQHRIVPPGGLARALASLPLARLDNSGHLEDRLRAVGVRTLGELARLSAASVASRYGTAGLALLQLARADRVSSHLGPPGSSVQQTPVGPSVRAQLPSPEVRAEAIQATLAPLLESLCVALQATGRAAVRVQLRLVLEDAPDTLLSIRLGQPGRDPARLGPLIRRRLENLQLSAPAVEVGLDVLESCPYHGRQHELLNRTEALEPLVELLARLLDTLGEGALFRAEANPVHRPEAAWVAVSCEPRQVGTLFTRPPCSFPPRPTLLLPEPRPLRVQLEPTGQVRAVEVEGSWRQVDTSVGPERLCGEWWTPDPFERDYHQLALADGRMAWVFLDRETGDWWLHGWFA